MAMEELPSHAEQNESLDEVEEAINELQLAVDTEPPGSHDWCECAFGLGNALWIRFGQSGSAQDLDDSIRLCRQALACATAQYPDRDLAGAPYHVVAFLLGDMLLTRFVRLEKSADSADAIKAYRTAMNAVPLDDPERASYSSSLGNALRFRFNRFGRDADLTEALALTRAAVATTPDGHPELPERLYHLSALLFSGFIRFAALADLNEAIDTSRRALDIAGADHPDRARCLAILAEELNARSIQCDDPADLDGAIEAGRQAAHADSPDRGGSGVLAMALAVALLSRFERFGGLRDLDEAIDVGRRAMDAFPADHPARAPYQFMVATMLRRRFDQSGRLADLDDSVEAGRQAVDTAPAGHPDRAHYLAEFGNVLRTRFERSGALADLDQAIEACREAVRDTPAAHRELAANLSSLSVTLVRRFDRAGDRGDLDEAIETGRQAVRENRAGPTVLNLLRANLGLALAKRFGSAGARGDLDQAIEELRRAVADTPADHAFASGYLANLGGMLGLRYARFTQPEDVDEAVGFFRRAVETSSAGTPEFAKAQTGLGSALMGRWLSAGSDSDAREAAASHVSAALVPSAPPLLRIVAARNAARLAGSRDPAGIAPVLKTAVGLLPRLASRHLARGDQQSALGVPPGTTGLDGPVGLASDAAALALLDPTGSESERAEGALRLLETGRTVLLGQALDTRSDLTDLTAQHPELARTFTELRDKLDLPAGSESGVADPVRSGASSPGSGDRRPLADRFDAVIEEIRALPGFASFAGLPSAEELVAYAEYGPVVTFNVSVYRSDALLLTTAGIVDVPLPGLDLDTLTRRVGDFRRALAVGSARDIELADQQDVQETIRDVLGWLWEAAAEPVLTALGYDGPPVDGDWPRVWWATGGLLGQLPLHAAGYHDENPAHAGQAVIDRVVSSYTPTIRALAYSRAQAVTARELSAGERDLGRSLIVAMPTTPDLPGSAPLPFAAREAEMLAARLPGPVLLTGPGFGEAVASGDAASRIPTLKSVLGYLPKCAIAHFACHGAHDPVDPSRSRLLLHDHATAPLTVAGIAPLHLKRARLAYLSACSTAFHDGGQLLDEAIHLAAAFQLLGFPHVVATFWAISDPIAVTVADRFYDHLRATPDCADIDPDRAAQALHHAIRELRSQPGRRTTPSVWAAYLHAGA